MPPISTGPRLILTRADADHQWRDEATTDGLVLEAWSEGIMVGSLIIMACITIAAMRRKVLLHKLILLEQCLAIPHGTFCFMSFKGYGWYISSTAALLYLSYILHNFVAWIKMKPFFAADGHFFGPVTCQRVKYAYLITLALSIPIWIFEIYNNFCYNNGTSNLFMSTRPYEPFFRDGWWLFTNIVLLHIIRKSYGSSLWQLISCCPRLGILLGAISLAMVFTIIDITVSSASGKLKAVGGINPYWKLSLIFKCLTDAIMLDDFKTELGRLSSARRYRESTQYSPEAVSGRHNPHSQLQDSGNGVPEDDGQKHVMGSLNHGNVCQIENAHYPES